MILCVRKGKEAAASQGRRSRREDRYFLLRAGVDA